MVRVYVFAVLIGFLLSDLSIAQVVNSAQSSSDDLQVVVSLEKTEFVEGEPIIASITLSNKSKTNRMLAEPGESYDTIEYSVFVVSSQDKPIRYPDGDKAGPPSDFGRVFAPEESDTVQVDIQNRFMDRLAVGTYSVDVVYSPPTMDNIWQGRIVISGPVFSVVKPSGNEAEAAYRFIKARKILRMGDSCVEALQIFKSLKNEAVGGRFAKYAGFMEAKCYDTMQDKERRKQAWKYYADHYGTVPFFGRCAIETVARDFFRSGDYDSAKAYLMKIPRDYNQQKLLSLCNKKLGE